mmetsp:Transcript_71696/g.149844  ORF Transcript_71696/g.149844 Transcript_71696/m.149844 type:complete len:115 (-) Transcript_71696:413-757(-)|eukprot:CAMPEP_0194765982 /NCGR_PEP_ID=MMETSP0323_2-20130528/27550_1 /TAXON_ID=2866 ORGANISM="Crypthecodinium cohnii, Strain Seligo" /NCGR_SAMPLE_ID=MMETSP0323_2 /ASSEMBLY_ACC=CAM_ASM_000346 /LENGTH=114 /DNA_ID=CAMNT_0039696443 /DNA_START=74 /DNA_END=418 /DNA_ORIENTATION=+
MGGGGSKGVANPAQFVQGELAKSGIVVFSKSYCPYCTSAKNALRKTGLSMEVHELDRMGEPRNGPVQQVLQSYSGEISVPQVFVGGKFFGTANKVEKLAGSGKLADELKKLGAA